MKAEVPKCFSLAIAASSGRRYVPALHLSGLHIQYIADHTIKFLGGPICVPQTNRVQQNHLVEKLQQLLQRVEEVPVTRKQKLMLYKAGICPKLNWDLGVMDLPISWVKTTLEAMAARYLKRLSGLARAADSSCLYLPKMEGGPPLSLLYRKLKVSEASLLLTSRDRITQLVTNRIIQQEESTRRIAFAPMVMVRDVMSDVPGASRSSLVRRSKGVLLTDDSDARKAHATSLSYYATPLMPQLKYGHWLWGLSHLQHWNSS